MVFGSSGENTLAADSTCQPCVCSDTYFLTFAEEPVTGSYRVGTDCRGTATITPKGHSEMHFSLVVVDCGKEMLAVETDADTVVSGTLQR